MIDRNEAETKERVGREDGQRSRQGRREKGSGDSINTSFAAQFQAQRRHPKPALQVSGTLNINHPAYLYRNYILSMLIMNLYMENWRTCFVSGFVII